MQWWAKICGCGINLRRFMRLCFQLLDQPETHLCRLIQANRTDHQRSRAIYNFHYTSCCFSPNLTPCFSFSGLFVRLPKSKQNLALHSSVLSFVFILYTSSFLFFCSSLTRIMLSLLTTPHLLHTCSTPSPSFKSQILQIRRMETFLPWSGAPVREKNDTNQTLMQNDNYAAA